MVENEKPKSSTTDAAPRKFQGALVVVAHPDDPEFLFGAAVAHLVNNGTIVTYVICTDGANGSRDPAVPAAQITSTRYEEQRAAAHLLGVSDVACLGFPDGLLAPTGALRMAIAREIRRYRPELVLTHYPRRVLEIPMEASHPDHLAAGEAALSAVSPDAGNIRAFPQLLEEGLQPHRVNEVWVAGHERPNHFIDASPFLDLKIQAILCHRSQFSTAENPEPPPWIYHWMKWAGSKVGCEYAESYTRIAM
jgi:LmbE family N-acetylglucosaminyl deacetylase